MIRHYTAVIHKDPDSCFGVYFPDVPGCTAAADSVDEVVAAGAEALRLYFEDTDPDNYPARSFDILLTDPEIRRDRDEGAMLVAVPYLANEGRSRRISVTFDGALLKAIDQAAGARKLTRAAFLAQAARNEIGV